MSVCVFITSALTLPKFEPFSKLIYRRLKIYISTLIEKSFCFKSPRYMENGGGSTLPLQY